MMVDHSGEIYHNRYITGPGSVKESVRIRLGKKSIRREQKWRWKCQMCGEEGESDYSTLAQWGHKCTQQPKTQKEEPYVCTEQCEGCGHYRGIMSDKKCCHYCLDTQKVRPKVDLRTTKCPVRDETYVAPVTTGVASLPPGLNRTESYL